METNSPKYVVEPLSEIHKEWFVEVAAISMLTYELKRPDLINIPRLYDLVERAELVLIVKANDCPVGAIAGFLVENLYNPNIKTLAEVMWYVLPSYRQTRAGAMLLKEFIKQGESMANDTTISLLASSDVNLESLEKRGFKLEEFAFRKENTWPPFQLS